MKLVIHIGLHKTGTSSLQAFCRSNRSALKKKGLLYPRTGVAELKLRSSATAEGGHRKLESVLLNPQSNSAQRKLKAIRQEADGANCKTILISSETFSAPRAKISEHLLPILQEIFSEVKILVYLRRQDLWSDSFYRECICWPRKRETRSYNEFCMEFLPEWLDYRSRLEKWEKVVGRENLLVRSYDDRAQKNIVEDIFREIGVDLPMDDMSVDYANNPSLPANLVPFIIEVNRRVNSHEQKSETTRKLFDELSKSEFHVETLPLTSTWLNKSMPSYAAQNLEIATHYKMPACERFVSLGDERVKSSKELSLPPHELDRIMPDRAENQPANLSGNDGSWGISCLSNERIAQTGAFIEYHLALGAARVIMFLDNPEDPIRNLVTDERVEFVACTEEFWRRELGRMPDSNAEKLWHCHALGLDWLRERDNVDWAINIDADELLWVEPGRTMSDILQHASKRANQVILPPLEAIFVDDSDADLFSAKYFKVLRHQPREESIYANFAKLTAKITRVLAAKAERYIPAVWRQLSKTFTWFGPLDGIRKTPLGMRPTLVRLRRWDAEDKRLYREAMPAASAVLREGFLGHRQGRVATASGVNLDVVKSHRHRSTEHAIIRTNSRGLVCILHYDAVDYDAWYLKWHRRVFGGANVLNIGEERKKQQDMFLAAVEAGNTHQLFKDLFFLPKEWLKPFLEQHLVVRITPPGIEEISAKWRAVEAEVQQDEAVSKAM